MAWPAALLVAFVVVSAAVSNVSAKVVGAWVLPHGDVALDPTRFPGNETQRKQARELNQCALSAGAEIAALRPDVVFISSPHGIAHATEWVLYANERASGDVLTEGEPPGRWNVTVELSRSLTLSLVTDLGRVLDNVSAITAFADDEEFPLRWGEVIPINFVAGATGKVPKVVVLTQPTKRHSAAVEMIPGLQTLGKLLWQSLERANERVAVVISADLAHTHDPAGPYGWSDAAQPFDDACGDWARSLSTQTLTVTAASYAPKALSCGFTGLVMLDAMLRSSSSAHGLAWRSHLCANHHPTYYGMLVASFYR
jgi:aromatic ring-opening dioxygenase LigB subunit